MSVNGEPGFDGRIERLVQDATPWWPEAPPAGVVGGDPGAQRRGRSCSTTPASPTSAATARDRDAEHRPARRRRAPLHRLPHHRAVLAVACLPAHRPQPPRRRHARRVELEHRASRTCAAASARGPRRSPSCCATTATRPTPPASGTWRRWRSARPPARTTTGRCRRASTASTASCRARPTSSTPSSRATTATSTRRPARGRLPRVRGHRRPGDGLDRDLQSVRPDRPFFLYLAFGATHAPHQAPAEYLDRWRGRFDEGYDVARDAWFARQLELGVVPDGHDAGAPQPGRAGVGRPHRQPAALRRPAPGGVRGHARAHRRPDRPARRPPRGSGELDDTLLMVLSDNGGRREGGPDGVMDEFSFFNGVVEDIDEHRRRAPRRHRRPALALELPVGLGPGRQLAAALVQAEHLRRRRARPARRALARRHRRRAARSATSSATPSTSPRRSSTCSASRRRRTGGASNSSRCTGRPWPTPGTSAAAPTRGIQYFEQMGHRGLWPDGWKAVTYHEQGTPFDDDEWELYHLDDDFSECHDLAAAEPEKLRELVDAWWAEAGPTACSRSTTAPSSCSGPRPGPARSTPDDLRLPAPRRPHPRRRGPPPRRPVLPDHRRRRALGARRGWRARRPRQPQRGPQLLPAGRPPAVRLQRLREPHRPDLGP